MKVSDLRGSGISHHSRLSPAIRREEPLRGSSTGEPTAELKDSVNISNTSKKDNSKSKLSNLLFIGSLVGGLIAAVATGNPLVGLAVAAGGLAVEEILSGE